MIRGPACGGWIDTIKPQFCKIEFIDKHINNANRIVLGNVVVEELREQGALCASVALDKPFHLPTPKLMRCRINASKHIPFTFGPRKFQILSATQRVRRFYTV